MSSPPPGLEERLASVDEVVRDPPQVHPAAPAGVWDTSPACYRFLARHCPPGARTLETGLGSSTVLFAAWGTHHTCIVSSQGEVDACLSHCKAAGIDVSRLDFRVGRSDQVLPNLDGDADGYDLFLIDGGHGFPTSIIDWYYGASRLRAGGYVVIDDTHLAQVSIALLRFLARDPRWTRVGGRLKWAAFRRESEGSLSEEYIHQDFLDHRFGPKRMARLGRRALSPLKRRLAKP
ncbi:MAG: class I SAM-dependent methyltransferase [Thermoleophilaceae bacterium]